MKNLKGASEAYLILRFMRIDKYGNAKNDNTADLGKRLNLMFKYFPLIII